MVNSEKLIGTTEYLTLYTRCQINRCRYKRVRQYLLLGFNSYSRRLRSAVWINRVLFIY
jgi:hypothetical protein